MIRWFARWLDRRVGGAKFFRESLNHIFPDHWSFMLGEIALYSFVILVLTGAFLAMFFNGSGADEVYHGSYHALQGAHMSAAFRSVMHISFDVPAGLLIRQMHHWAALIFVGAIVAHLARLFFTAAYRRPRELNWMIGVTLLICAIFNGYFGYSLADDVLSGGGVRIAYSILLSVPLFGKWLAYIVFGGNIPADPEIPRMYALHIFVIPAVIAVLIALHLAIIWRQYHTNYPGPRRTDRTIVGSRLWPSYTIKTLGLFCLLAGLITGLAAFVQVDPVWVYGPYDPMTIIPGAQPDWYLGWIEGAMRLWPRINIRWGHHLVPELFFPAVLFPTLVFLMLYAYPYLDQAFTFDTRNHHVLRLPYQQPFNTATGCAGFMMILVLLFAGGDDVVAVATNTAVATIRVWLRILFFAAPGATWILVYLRCKRKLRKEAGKPAPPESLEAEEELTRGI